MKFDLSEPQQVRQFELIENGWYPFEIIEAKDSVSKKGNPMIELKLRLDVNGTRRVLKDYVLGAFPHKLKRFAESIGAEDQYRSRDIQTDALIGKAAMCNVIKEAGRDGKDRNSVVDYMSAESPAERDAQHTDDAAGHDTDTQQDIPF